MCACIFGMARSLPLRFAALHCAGPRCTALHCTVCVYLLHVDCSIRGVIIVLAALFPCGGWSQGCSPPLFTPAVRRLSLPHARPTSHFRNAFAARCGSSLQIVCTAQQGQGLEILGAFVLRDGALFLDVDVGGVASRCGSHCIYCCFFSPLDGCFCCFLHAMQLRTRAIAKKRILRKMQAGILQGNIILETPMRLS